MAVTIQLRGDTAANWTTVNPVLAERELGIETDTLKNKIGNGIDAWNDLPYTPSGSGGEVDSVNGQTGVVVLDKTDIGLSNVDNTSDAGKPISTATQTALNGKQALATVLTNTTASFTTTLETKLNGIEAGAEVNNISDANATDLTDGGDTTLHTHDGRYYTETETDTLLSGKQPLATVLTNTTASFTTTLETKLNGIEAGADVTDATNVAAAGAVMESDYSPAHSLLVQQSGTGSPSSLSVPNNTILGRLSGGGSNIDALTASEVRGLINVEDGAEVNNISDANATDLTDGGDTTLHTHDSRYYTETETDNLLSAKQKTITSGTAAPSGGADGDIYLQYI